MTDRVELSLIFGVGVIAEVLLLAGPGIRQNGLRSGLGRFGFAALMSLAEWLPVGHERDYRIYDHILQWWVLFAAYAFIVFWREILPRVSESSVLVSSIVLWYLFASVNSQIGLQPPVVALAVVLTAFTLAVGLLSRDWGFAARLVSSVWYLVMTGAIDLLLTRFVDLSFIGGRRVTPPNLLDLVLAAMCFTYLASVITYILILLGIPRILRSAAESRAHELVGSRFAAYPMMPGEAVLTIAAYGGACLLNLQLHAVSTIILAGVGLVVIPVASRLLNRRPGMPAHAGKWTDTSWMN